MFIKQITVYLENRNGALREMVEVLGLEGINLLALSIADTTDFGIVRMIVRSDTVDKALSCLRSHGSVAKVNNVLCVKMPHQPNSFAKILLLLEQGSVSVEYCYSFCRSTLADAIMVIRPSDKPLGEKILLDGGVELVDQDTVDHF